MIGYIIWGVIFCALLGLAGTAFFQWVNAILDDGELLPRWASLLLAIGLTFATIVALAGIIEYTNDDSPGVHSWRGGAGPSTVCQYEVHEETRMVGKVPITEDVTYTVCRDPR